MDNDDADKGVLPLTPATAFLYENLLPSSQRQVQQQVLSDDGTILNPLPPAAIELAREYGCRQPEDQ